MSGNLRVFVSSTCNDLFEERRAIASGLLHNGHAVVLSEMPKHMPVDPYLSCIESCLDAVTAHCDVLVLVISASYGSSDSEGRSVTLQEYLRARELGIPVITFVRQKILDFLPVYRQAPETSFLPVVSDNKLFGFVVRIMEEQRGNWVFGFTDAQSIVDILKFQLSCMLRTRLADKPQRVAEPVYLHVSNITQLLRKDGSCIRTLDHVIRNDATFPIDRIYGGDHSDRPMTFEDMNLDIRDAQGVQLAWKPLVETPGFRRWDIILRKPLLPGESVRLTRSYNSCDLLQMQTWVNYPVQTGWIKYLLPCDLAEGPVSVGIRDNAGWRESPPEVIVQVMNGVNVVTCPFTSESGFFQFRLNWGPAAV